MTVALRLPDASTPLDHETARAAFDDILDGRVADAAVAEFLTAMTLRDETSGEITAAAQAMRARMVVIAAPTGAIDVCGTGGDGSHSLNVSTAVAIVVAACGVPVAKHGNRAASSKAGAADTLEALGLDLTRASEAGEDTLAELGIAFLFAQKHHPALARLAPVRRAIGQRTIFNLIGPLANPARVTRQLIGVARPDFLGVYAGALELLGADDAMLVAGDEPLDELSVAGPSTVVRLGGEPTRIEPEDVGLQRHPVDALRGGDPGYNAAALLALLGAAPGAYRNAVLFNAAAALIVAGLVEDWRDGIEVARDAIDAGTAATLLARWIEW